MKLQTQTITWAYHPSNIVSYWTTIKIVKDINEAKKYIIDNKIENWRILDQFDNVIL